MGTLTDILGLYKPDNGETGWGDEVDANFDTLDGLADETYRATTQWENVKHPTYGATGTFQMDTVGTGPGTGADDTQAFKDAIATSFPDNDYFDLSGDNNDTKTIYVPAGHYQITDTLELPRGTTLRGAGMGSVLINRLENSDPVLLLNSECMVENLLIYGHQNYTSASTGPAIQITDASGVTIRSCWFRYICGTSTWAVDAWNSIGLRVEDCKTSGCEGGGIRLQSTCNASIITNNNLSNGGFGEQGGVYVGSDGVVVENNIIEAWRGDYGLKVKAGEFGVLISRNWFEDDDGYHIWLDGAGSHINQVTLIENGSSSCYVESVHGLTAVGGGLGTLTLKSTNSSGLQMLASFLGVGITSFTNSLAYTNEDRVRFVGCVGDATDATPAMKGVYLIGPAVASFGNKVLATGGIGVGNSASATTPGSVVKKMEVFDATGSSLGYVPIYSSIT